MIEDGGFSSFPQPFKHLFEWIIAINSSVSQVKKEILDEMKRKCAIEIPYNRCRLRKKVWRTPTRPYLDGRTFDDLTNSWELFVQELPGDDPVTSPEQKLLTVRQFNPCAREPKPYEELVLNNDSFAEFKEKVRRKVPFRSNVRTYY